MKKIDLGQTVTILANVGVLVGILLLVYELNQNRQMMQAQTRNAVSETLVDMLFQAGLSPQYAAIVAKLGDGEPLTAAETLQYRNVQTAFWRYRENVSYQYRNGLYEESEYFAQREAWRGGLNGDGPQRAYWCDRSSAVVSPEFFAEISELMEQPCE